MAVGVVWAAITATGAICNSILLMVILRERSFSSYRTFLLSLIIANTLHGLLSTIIHSLHLANHRYSFDKEGCIWQAISYLAVGNISLVSSALMLADRYSVIIKQKYLEEHEVRNLVIFTWSMPPVMAGLAFATKTEETLFGIQSSGLYCFMAAWDRHLMNVIQVPLVILSGFQCSFAMFYLYRTIYRFYQDLNRKNKVPHALQESEMRRLANMHINSHFI